MPHNSDTRYPSRDDILANPLIRLNHADQQVTFLAFKIKAAVALLEENFMDADLVVFIESYPQGYALTALDILLAQTYP